MALSLPVYTVTVKDGSAVCGRILVAAPTMADAANVGKEWAADTYGPGFRDHYKCVARPKLQGGQQMRTYISGRL